MNTPLWLLVLTTSAVYSLVNSTLLAYQLQREFRLPRLKHFFKDALFKTAFSIFAVLIFVGLFSSFFCRIRILLGKIVGSVPTSCPVIPTNALLIQITVPVIIIFALVKATIQWSMIESTYAQLSTTTLVRILFISNAAAALAHYGILKLL